MTTIDPALQAASDRMQQLQKAVENAQRLADDWQRTADEYRARNDALARAVLRSQERERIAAEAYNQQQQSYRDLEALYTAMTERAQAAEAELARRRQAAHLNEA